MGGSYLEMKPDFHGKGLRKLKAESVAIAQKTSARPAFQEKFINPRRLRTGPSILASPFSERLREWRRENDWYAKEAANILGVPLETYRGWEKGKHLPSVLARGAVRACLKAYPGKENL